MLLGSWHFYSLFYFNKVTADEWNFDISLVNEKELSVHFWESKQKSCFSNSNSQLKESELSDTSEMLTTCETV